MTNPSRSSKSRTKKIGAYTVQSVLGRGRFGSVVLAKSDDNQHYAIKILSKQIGQSPKMKEALTNWVQIMNALDSIGVVQILELGFASDHPYLVMPLMQGGSLTHQLQSSPLTEAQTHDALQHIATTLHTLHNKDLFHGSLHPGNILFHQSGVPLLTDVGLATILAPETDESFNLPGYISPEQIKGGKGDGRSDIYALGTILYEMLTGYPAYIAETPAKITMKQMKTSIPSVQIHNPDLSSVYDGLISRLAAANARYRKKTASIMLELIQATIQQATGIMPIESELGKDLFEKFAGYVKKEESLEERLNAIEKIRVLKETEEKSSQIRMDKLLSREKERQKTVRAANKKKQQKDKFKATLALIILVSIIIIIAILFILAI
ncbi:MAG: serine/threonine protein kinase [Chloroflexi bacterium]|nr:serine/threonine protein kinase [Chloroflexota bacterium]